MKTEQRCCYFKFAATIAVIFFLSPIINVSRGAYNPESSSEWPGTSLEKANSTMKKAKLHKRDSCFFYWLITVVIGEFVMNNLYHRPLVFLLRTRPEPTPSACSVHVFVGKNVNTLYRIYCSRCSRLSHNN